MRVEHSGTGAITFQIKKKCVCGFVSVLPELYDILRYDYPLKSVTILYIYFTPYLQNIKLQETVVLKPFPFVSCVMEAKKMEKRGK
jgi:hypothetical protein